MTEIVPHKSVVVEAYSPGWVDLVKSQVAKGATDDELKLFLYHCKKTGLDPLAKQIYFQKRRSKSGDQMTILTGIDGYRLTAQRTGEYAGSDDAIFDDEQNPRKASVTVYRMMGGQRCAFTASARWDQYYPGDQQGFMWRKMPHLMLGKCAEALALRKAFPAELSGVYTKEEMEQAAEPVAPPADLSPSKYVQNARNERFEIPFGSAAEEIYTGTDPQKIIFRREAKALGITHVVHLQYISKEIEGLGVLVNHIGPAIREWLELHRDKLPPAPENA